MSRSASRGLTLIEIAVALAVSGILVAALAVFFRGFSRSFNLQEQVSDRDLNAHYAVKRLSEVIMAAGANLPSKDWDIIQAPKGQDATVMRIAVNPRGGVQYVAAAGFVQEIFVDEAKGFAKAGSLLVDPIAGASATFKVAIDRGHDGGGYTDGVKPDGSGAWLRLASGISVYPGDAVYAYDEEVYSLSGTDLMLGDMVLAENIESVAFSFLTSGRAPTVQWSAMRSARVRVVARTRLPDPDLKSGGGFRRLTLSTDVLMRNRI